MSTEPVEIGTYRGIRFHEVGDSDRELEEAFIGRNPKDLRGWYVVPMKPEEFAPFRVMSKLHGIHLTDAVLRNGFVREIFKNDPEFVWKEPDPPPSNACTQCGGTGETPSLLGTFASYTCTRCKGSKAELAITPPAVLLEPRLCAMTSRTGHSGLRRQSPHQGSGAHRGALPGTAP